MLIDIGVNLTNSRFDKDRENVINQAQLAGVTKLIITGTNVVESQQALDICQHYPNLFCTAGVHPHDADNVSNGYLQQLAELAKNKQVKAIGECGLDFNRNFSTPENQQRVFTEQLELAKQLSLPVFLHQRDAFNTWQSLLQEQLNELTGGVSHCFTGNLEELKTCLDMGLYIGITGWICDERRGQELFDIAKYIPLDRIMVETDAPYLPPRNIRPKLKSSRNEPKYLPYVVRTLASAMKVGEDELIKHSSNNATKLFKLAG
ncbi:TatD family hydrolase [Thalassotalea fonticola]|uniref:TatD family hydrolase n=1 Tax=Thalassotalea fonticola TaxID=3065649 RepID=A0ABZ0GK16_9GAMM|nr:TatD family hydrolase [Colwelliaceae bacterium S1-1]